MQEFLVFEYIQNLGAYCGELKLVGLQKLKNKRFQETELELGLEKNIRNRIEIEFDFQGDLNSNSFGIHFLIWIVMAPTLVGIAHTNPGIHTHTKDK